MGAYGRGVGIMVRVGDVIPEKTGRDVNVTVDAADGQLVVNLDGKKTLDVTQGEGKVILLALIEVYGKKYVKKMLKLDVNWEET